MVLAEIKAWLAEPKKSYSKGLEFYNQYKKNNNKDKFFASVENPELGSMHFNLLVTQVRNIHRKLSQNPKLIKSKPIEIKKLSPVIKAGDKKKSKPTIVDNPLVDVKELPPQLQEKYFENKQLVKDIMMKRQEMTDLGEGSDVNDARKTLANKICELDDKKAANWKAIDTWWNEKKNPQQPQQPETEAKKVKKDLRRIENLKIYIPRDTKKMQANPDKADEYKSKIENYKKELTQLEAKYK